MPVIPLLDVVGNAGAPEFWHNGPIAVNVGVTGAVITTVMVVLVPHWPLLGVKV